MFMSVTERERDIVCSLVWIRNCIRLPRVVFGQYIHRQCIISDNLRVQCRRHVSSSFILKLKPNTALQALELYMLRYIPFSAACLRYPRSSKTA